MANEPRFDPLRDIQSIGEQITRQVEKGIRAVTSPARRCWSTCTKATATSTSARKP